MNARALTGHALSAALKRAVDPGISAALQRNAERLRVALEDVENGTISGNSRHALDIAVPGQDLFAREFGTLDAPADPVIAPAIDRLKRRSR